jgi:hypothetical protein
LIPLDIGSGAPDLNEDALELYRARLFAMYPVTAVELTVGEPLRSSASSMCSHLASVGSRRSADDAPVDLYYYGLTLGLSGGQSGCSNATSTASSSSKTSAGWHTVTMNDRGRTGSSTMCHELGHAHGRQHAPCGVSDGDRNYPYPNADIGVWAHDLRTQEFMSPTRKDMMSYCPNPDRSLAWLSDYTYQAILERVAAVNQLVARGAAFLSTAPKLPWRMLVVDETGEQWSEHALLVRGRPEGTALTATVHDRSGPMQTIEVYRQDLEAGAVESYLLIVPERDPSWHAIEVPGLLPKIAF